MTFLTIANSGYMVLTRNLALNFQQPFMLKHRLIVACLDKLAMNSAASWKFKNLHVCQSVNGYQEFAEYGTLPFREVVKHKFPIICNHLNQETDYLWYLDGDIGIFGDPANHIIGTSDLQMQTDEPNQTGINWCTGCFVVRSTVESRSFFSALSRHSYIDNILDDQKMFNIFVRKTGFVFSALDPKRFQNGHKAINCNWCFKKETVIVHVNYRRGKQSKIQALRKCGKWFNSKRVANP